MKMRHFIPTTRLTTPELVTTFVNRIYSLHGCPDTIVSDRGTQFVSQFWRQLSERLGIALRPLSAFHPEIDSQTERVNSSIKQYLQMFMNYHQDDWVDWFPLTEFASNNIVSKTIGVSPFFTNYGFNP
jgi:transposase InsO family protein